MKDPKGPGAVVTLELGLRHSRKVILELQTLLRGRSVSWVPLAANPSEGGMLLVAFWTREPVAAIAILETLSSRWSDKHHAVISTEMEEYADFQDYVVKEQMDGRLLREGSRAGVELQREPFEAA